MAAIGATHRKWWILGAMGGVLGLIVLDETVVGVALPTLREDLGLTQTGAHWVINAYLLALTGGAVAGGRLGDRFGHRSVFVAGMALFGLGSCAAGFATGRHLDRPRPCCPGARRGRRLSRHHHHDHGGLSARATGACLRHSGRHGRHLHLARSACRRLLHRGPDLALDLLDQPAGGRRHRPDRAGRLARPAAPGDAATT